jgi:hypothetical protein
MVRKNVAEILTKHVTFELEAIDRMYLNAYVPSLQTGGGFVWFAKTQLGARVPSTMMVAPMSQRFVEAIARFVVAHGIDLVTFEKGQRKDDVAQQYLASFEGEEGVLFVGKAQEKASVFRTEKRRDAAGVTYPWIIRSTAMVNHYYVYILDRDFGPLFPQVLLVLSVPCEALSEWTRVAEAPVDAAGGVVRAAGQWHSLERRTGPRAANRRHAGRRQDRRGLPQVAPATAAMFYARLYTRALRPACSLPAAGSTRAQRALDRLDAALAFSWRRSNLPPEKLDSNTHTPRSRERRLCSSRRRARAAFLPRLFRTRTAGRTAGDGPGRSDCSVGRSSGWWPGASG